MKTAEVNEHGQDRYGRVIGYVRCAGANAAQVRKGLAWVFERYAPADSPLYTLQDVAGSNGVAYGRSKIRYHLGSGALRRHVDEFVR